MFADDQNTTLAWIGALSPLIMAIAAVLGAVAVWIKSKATVDAVEKVGKDSAKRDANTATILATSTKAAAAEVKDVKTALEQHTSAATETLAEHGEQLGKITELVNGNTSKMLEEIASLQAQVTKLTADAKKP